MGSFSELTIADYPICSAKNSYYYDIKNLLFLPEDFVSEMRKNSTRNKLVWGDAYLEDKESYIFKGYKQTAKVCKERLELFGMTLQNAKKDFALAKKIAVSEGSYDFPILKVSFDKYLNEISDIIKRKDKSYELISINLREDLVAEELGIHGQMLSSYLYCIISVVPEDSLVEFNLTEVIDGGWVKEEDAKHVVFQKIIVLTEGRTDVEFISGTMRKLYPYLCGYYHFIDFEEYKVEANASALVKLVIAFAAANVKHPIIVLFDNDTTGIKEMKKLEGSKLSDNFRVLKLPNTETAKNFPTKGPTGIKRMNVNGFACGIEMYFGKDILMKEMQLYPIQWSSYDEKEKKYQGEISQKSVVQNAFRQKLNSDETSDFADMQRVLQEIFKAFH